MESKGPKFGFALGKFLKIGVLILLSGITYAQGIGSISSNPIFEDRYFPILEIEGDQYVLSYSNIDNYDLEIPSDGLVNHSGHGRSMQMYIKDRDSWKVASVPFFPSISISGLELTYGTIDIKSGGSLFYYQLNDEYYLLCTSYSFSINSSGYFRSGVLLILRYIQNSSQSNSLFPEVTFTTKMKAGRVPKSVSNIANGEFEVMMSDETIINIQLDAQGYNFIISDELGINMTVK